MSTLEPVLGDTFLARKFNQTTPMTPVETVSPFPIASSTLPATTLGGTETIMQSTTDMPPAPLMSSTSTSFPLQTEQIGLKQVLPSETLSTQPIVSEGSEGVVGANVMAPASTSLVNQLPVITKELIHERPILEAVHERTFIERRTINNVQEIHEQPIIEIHEKPVIRTIQEAAEVKRFTAPNALREEINQPVSYTLPRPGTIQRIKEAYVAKVNVAPVVREVIRREHVRIIEQPMIVEVRHKPIIEIYEQPILRIFHEKPVFRTIKVAAVTEGITAAPVPLGAVPQQQVMSAPQPLQESLPLQSEASGQVISSSTQILSASNMGATTLPVSSSTQFLPSSTLSSSTLQGTALPATSSFSSSTASSMNTGPVLVPDAPVGAGLRSGQVVGSEILPTSAAGATSLGAVPQQQFMSAPMQAAPAQSVLPPIFKEQRLDQSGLPSNIAMFLKSSQSPAPLANASMPGTVYRSPIV